MGWNNPQMRWKELERRLSGLPGADDAPVSRRKRPTTAPRDVERPALVTPYAELHCHSHYSFLDGASSPVDLVEEAVRLGLTALAITDHDGFYGAPALAEAAAGYALPTVFGAELSLGLTGPQNGVPDPEGTHLLVLARGVEGYHRLAAAMTEAHLRGDEKGRPVYDLDELGARGRGHWVVLTGCRKGLVPQPLLRGAPDEAAAALDRLTALFGLDDVLVELQPAPRRGRPQRRAGRAGRSRTGSTSSQPGTCTTPRPRATGWPRRWPLSAPAAAWPSSTGGSTSRRPATCAAEPRWPRPFPSTPQRSRAACPSPRSWRSTCAAPPPACPSARSPRATPRRRGCGSSSSAASPSGTPARRWSSRPATGSSTSCGSSRRRTSPATSSSSTTSWPSPASAASSARAGAPRRARRSATRSASPRSTRSSTGSPSSGSSPRTATRSPTSTSTSTPTAARRSSSGSTTPTGAATPHRWRTSSPTGRGWRSATPPRPSATPPGQQDAWSKQIDGWQSVVTGDQGNPGAHDVPAPVVALAEELLGAPRHLGIHSGGMVLTERPIGEVCPIERARMDRRTVLQWDKDSCESMGLVKFDLLGLGMLGALDHMIRLVEEHLGEPWTLATMPKEEPAVYDMLCRADSDRCLPGREPRPDRHPPAAASPRVLRPRDRDRADPPGTDPGRRRPPLHPPRHRPGAGQLRPSRPRPGARADPRGAAVPGAAHGDGGGARRLQP